MGEEPENKVLLKQERGKGFPKLSLSSAVEVIDRASKYGRQWTREQFATYGSKASKGSAKSGAFINRLAALKDFGLIDTSGVLIVRTELANQIVKPIRPEEREQAIREAFLNVEIFKSIVETVEKNEDLSKSDIAEMAVKQLGVTRNAKDAFVSSFVESGKFAGLVAELDKDVIKISDFTSETKNQEILSPTDIQTVPSSVFEPQISMQATSFKTQRAGKTWDINVQIRATEEMDTELMEKVVKLIQDAEEMGKLFKKKEESGNGASDNKS